MRYWRWQKIIGFDLCKIWILTGHDIQMTWQPSINIKRVCKHISDSAEQQCWLFLVSWQLIYFSYIFQPVLLCSDVIWKQRDYPKLISMISDPLWWEWGARWTDRQSFNQASLFVQPSPGPLHNPLLCVLWCRVSTGTVITATINRINQFWHWALWSRWRV